MKYYCIKTLTYTDGEIIFKKGKWYEKSDFYDDEYNMIGMCHENKKTSAIGFHKEYDQNYPFFRVFTNYFASIKQMRNIKLQKILQYQK